MGNLISSPQLLTEITVFRSDGSIKMRRMIEPPPRPPDTLTFRVRNVHGDVVRELKVPVRSFVANWSKVFGTSGLAGSSVDVIRTTGASYTVLTTFLHNILSAAGLIVSGIVLGTDNGTILPLATTNSKLGAIITHGTGAGTLDYSEQYFMTPTISDSTCTYRVWRTFTNSSGNTITVKEAGIYAVFGTTPTVSVMLLRDLYDADSVPINVAVGNNQTLEVAYDFSVTQASGYVSNFSDILNIHWQATAGGTLTYVATSGLVKTTTSASLAFFDAFVAEGINVSGVQVGTSSAALDLTHYSLQGKIVHGETAGKLFYGQTEAEAYWADGNDMYTAIKRTFSNHSGGNITVEEAGIYIRGRSTLDADRAMLARTLTGGVTLNDAGGEHESVQIRYIIKHTL